MGRYRDLVSKTNKFSLEKHEVLQHAWLKAKGFAGKARLGGNPVIALPKNFHAKVSALQKAKGLHDPAKLATTSLSKLLRENKKILIDLKVPEAKVNELIASSREFFKTLKKIDID